MFVGATKLAQVWIAAQRLCLNIEFAELYLGTLP